MKKILWSLLAVLWFIFPIGIPLKAQEKTYPYKIEYFYDEVLEKAKTEIRKAGPGDLIISYPEKQKNGYELFYTTIDEDGLTVTDHIDSNLIRIYYTKIGTANGYYSEPVGPPKTGIYVKNNKNIPPILFLIFLLLIKKVKQ